MTLLSRQYVEFKNFLLIDIIIKRCNIIFLVKIKSIIIVSKSLSSRASANIHTEQSEKPLTIEQNVAHIIGTVLQDTVRYNLNNAKLKLEVAIGTNKQEGTTPAHNFVQLTFESEEIADRFFASLEKAHSPRLSSKVKGDYFKIGQQEDKIGIFVSDLEDIPFLVEAIIEISSHTVSQPKKARREQDLADDTRVNIRFLPTQFGFSSKQRLIEFYNKASQDLSQRPYGTFSYTPNDMRQAISSYLKFVNKTKGLSAHQTLMIH